MDILRNITNFWEEYSDQRTKGLFLMDSPYPTFIICLLYVYLSWVLGPKLMNKRESFKLNNLIIFFNLFQVNLSIWLFYKACISGWIGNYNYRCQPVDYSTSPSGMRAFNFSYWYYLSKFVDLFDTFFFVLRKKYQNVSTLHVVHHGTMPFTAWWMMKFVPGGHATFVAFLNAFVHIIMYSYYFISSLGPKYQKYLRWKKYLTLIQILQFILVGIHAMQLFFVKCDFPLWVAYFHLGHVVLYLILFGNFYMKAYNTKKTKLENNNTPFYQIDREIEVTKNKIN